MPMASARVQPNSCSDSALQPMMTPRASCSMNPSAGGEAMRRSVPESPAGPWRGQEERDHPQITQIAQIAIRLYSILARTPIADAASGGAAEPRGGERRAPQIRARLPFLWLGFAVPVAHHTPAASRPAPDASLTALCNLRNLWTKPLT